jgi:glycosyltransferase involved in cell wall biosynthesis
MSVSALRYGAGVKGKIVSSLEVGVPVITTSIGNEGIGLEPNVEALIGETPEELAQHIIRLFNDCILLRALSDAGKRVVAERFSEAEARTAFFRALGLGQHS